MAWRLLQRARRKSGDGFSDAIMLATTKEEGKERKKGEWEGKRGKAEKSRKKKRKKEDRRKELQDYALKRQLTSVSLFLAADPFLKQSSTIWGAGEMCSYTIPKAVTLIALPNPLRKPVNVLKIYHHAFKSLLYFQNMREMPINAIRCYLVDHSFGSKQCYFRHLNIYKDLPWSTVPLHKTTKIAYNIPWIVAHKDLRGSKRLRNDCLEIFWNFNARYFERINGKMHHISPQFVYIVVYVIVCKIPSKWFCWLLYF